MVWVKCGIPFFSLQMLTVNSLLQKDAGPVAAPLRCRVAAIGSPVEYSTDRGDQKQLMNFSVADSSGCIKGTLFDMECVTKLAVGHSVIIKDFILKAARARDENKTVVVTSKSSVMKCGKVAVPESKLQEALDLLFPPPPPVSPIRMAKQLPAAERTTIAGKVIQVGVFHPSPGFPSYFFSAFHNCFNVVSEDYMYIILLITFKEARGGLIYSGRLCLDCKSEIKHS